MTSAQTVSAVAAKQNSFRLVIVRCRAISQPRVRQTITTFTADPTALHRTFTAPGRVITDHRKYCVPDSPTVPPIDKQQTVPHRSSMFRTALRVRMDRVISLPPTLITMPTALTPQPRLSLILIRHMKIGLQWARHMARSRAPSSATM